MDEAFIADYVRVANAARKGNRSPFDAWLRHWVLEPADHAEYLDRVGIRSLLALGDLFGTAP